MKNKECAERETIFSPEFREDLSFWIQNDRKSALRIMALVDSTVRDPFTGIGKPEPLRYLGSGVWSRRITQEHRLVYIVEGEKLIFIQCRYHY